MFTTKTDLTYKRIYQSSMSLYLSSATKLEKNLCHWSKSWALFYVKTDGLSLIRWQEVKKKINDYLIFLTSSVACTKRFQYFLTLIYRLGNWDAKKLLAPSRCKLLRFRWLLKKYTCRLDSEINTCICSSSRLAQIWTEFISLNIFKAFWSSPLSFYDQ